MNKTAVITGAGSGVGQSLAVKLAAQGWRVAIVGRRAEALQETIHLAGSEADLDAVARAVLKVPLADVAGAFKPPSR